MPCQDHLKLMQECSAKLSHFNSVMSSNYQHYFPLFKNFLVLINFDVERNPEPYEFLWCVQAFLIRKMEDLEKLGAYTVHAQLYLDYVFRYTKKSYPGSQEIQSKFQKKGVSYIKIKINCIFFLQNLTTQSYRTQGYQQNNSQISNSILLQKIYYLIEHQSKK